MAPHVRALGDPRSDPWQESLTMTATTGAAHSAQPKRPGRSDGVCNEFTVFTKIKPGHADALREDLAAMADAADDEKVHAAVRQIGTLHDARHVIFDNDTRFMFASVFDGSWDTYIDDFAKTVVGARFDSWRGDRRCTLTPPSWSREDDHQNGPAVQGPDEEPTEFRSRQSRGYRHGAPTGARKWLQETVAGAG